MGSGICRELLSLWCLELRDKNPALQRGIDGSSKRGPAMRAEEGQKQDMKRGRGRDEMELLQTHSLMNSEEMTRLTQYCDA